MKRKDDTIIFLTGCINPGEMIFTALMDPEIRREQYVASIRFYLNQTEQRVLFVENSNNDISSYFETEILNDELEIITFDGNTYDKNLGKGYGEMLIVEHALKFSTFFKTADFIFKITGRLKVLNLRSILKQVETNPKIEVLVNLQKNLTYSDSRCWGATKRFFSDILMAYKNQVDDTKGIHFEHCLSKSVHQAIIESYCFEFIANLPRYSGIKGTENKKIRDSLFFWLPLYIKHKVRLNVLKK